MPDKKKGTFDYLNFAYGLGASIVIVGAMFKFLGWEYANEMFLIGLTTEAIIFLVSGVEFKTQDDGLKWERVFPQLDPKYQGEIEKIDLSEAQNLYFKNTERLVDNISVFNESIEKLNEVVGKLNADVERIGTGIDRIDSASTQYENELNNLAERMRRLNTFYNEMNWVAGNENHSKSSN